MTEFEKAVQVLLNDTLSAKFCNYFYRRNNAVINWDNVETLKKKDFPAKYDEIVVASKSKLQEYLGKLVILKLNGGLGTSMGLSGPKTLITVKDNKCFLEMFIDQVGYLNEEYGVNIPIILMNSFATEADTKKFISNFPKFDIRCFNQNRFPRLRQDNCLPLAKSPDDPENCWNPPGHGEVYDCLYYSGLLDQLISEGKEYIFLGNGDNMGSNVDLRVLTHLFSFPPAERRDVVSEQTDKLPVDVKGGSVIRYNFGEGKGDKAKYGYRLLEVAMVPPEHMKEFTCLDIFETFNCNNLWVRLAFLRKKYETEPFLQFDVFKNLKTVTVSPSTPPVPVIQLESAMGGIVQCVDPARIDLLLVPRLRYIPTKACSELVFVRSNYFLSEHGILRTNPDNLLHEPTRPVIFMRGPWFQKVKDMEARVPEAPDMRLLVRLETDGDVSFGKGVVLKGTVLINAGEGKITIPDGTVLENVRITEGMKTSPLE